MAVEYIKPLLSSDCRQVITTRLDNDDAVDPKLLELVANAASVGHFEFINATNGLVVNQNRFYRKRDLSNAFISASEPVESFRTVWLDQHHRLGKYAPIKQLPLKDAWIQIIHGSNLANRVRGVRAAVNN